MNILSPSGMRDLEGAAEKSGLSPSYLMNQAASAAYGVIRRYYNSPEKRILLICGRGNNGGDGLALAALLHHDGDIFLPLGDPPPGSPGAFHLARCVEKGIPLYRDWEDLPSPEENYSLLVDALFGTGLNRPVEGDLARLLKKINQAKIPVVSLDIPSGVNGLNGRIEGEAVVAERTITFGLPKAGNLLYPGYERGGELFLSSLSIGEDLLENQPAQFKVNRPLPLPNRSPNGHKTSWGRLLVVGGSSHYGGAPRFAAQAFMKSGGGYVHMALPRELILPLTVAFPEAVLHPQKSEKGALTVRNEEDILRLTEGKGLLVIGPGLGLREETGELVRSIVSRADLPLIIDGDGLTHVAGREDLLRGKEVYLTPHPGEAARLLGISPEEGEKDRPATVRALADRYGARVVLKGAHSLLSCPGEGIYMNLSGDSSLATAGSGDILCGIVASLLGRGMKGLEALGTAVFLHGLTGEEAGRKLGRDGVTATDILDCLPGTVREYRRNYDYYKTGIEGKIRKII
ncbi:MAG: NAD(P)H-hydrate dehydratase [Spirochaetales bacterium]|nr:NAD(P)H-hydrate dehydratase [Spirochaetales bacterium]